MLTRRPATLPTFRLPVAAKGLSVAQDAHGALKFSDAKGKPAAGFERAVGATMDPRGDEPTRVSTLASSLTTDANGTALMVSPSQAFLDDPAVTYPVTLDPSSSLSKDHFTSIDRSAPTTSFSTTTQPATWALRASRRSAHGTRAAALKSAERSSSSTPPLWA